MKHPIPHEQLDPVWDGVFLDGEKVLWTGRPEYGREFWEFEREERILFRSVLVGIAVIWISAIFFAPSQVDPGVVFGIVFFATAVLVFQLYYGTSSRVYVMNNLFYAVTDRKAVIVRRGGDWKLASRRYVISYPFQRNYAFLVHPGGKYGSVQVGSHLGTDTVQPLGFGLAHPGWSVGRAIGVTPALFESVSNADELSAWLQHLTDNLHAIPPHTPSASAPL